MSMIPPHVLRAYSMEAKTTRALQHVELLTARVRPLTENAMPHAGARNKPRATQARTDAHVIPRI